MIEYMTLVEDSQNVTVVTLEDSYHPCSAASDFGGDMEVCSVERRKNPRGVIFGNNLELAQFGEVMSLL